MNNHSAWPTKKASDEGIVVPLQQYQKEEEEQECGEGATKNNSSSITLSGGIVVLVSKLLGGVHLNIKKFNSPTAVCCGWV